MSRKSLYLSDTEVEKLTELAKTCDFVRWTIPDVNCISRSLVTPAKTVEDYVESGISVANFFYLMNSRCNIMAKSLMDDPNKGFGNVFGIPDVDTWRKLEWAGDGKFTICQVICDIYKNPQTEIPVPRYIAKQQLKELKSMDLDIMMAIEFEFQLFHEKTLKPVYEGTDIFSDLVFLESEGILYKLAKNLESVGIEINGMHTEYGDGQFEFSTKPAFGLKALDDFVRFKHVVKEVCQKEGYVATFMAKPFMGVATNSCHFNHSLWKNKTNAFSSENDENKMSDLMKHWIAGILKHAKALCVFNCPSVNCYRRMHQMALPTLSNWGIDNRMTTLRVKNYSPSQTYIESRLPSGISNPYLVAASTIAARLDGIRNKLELPTEADQAAAKLPTNIADALDALKDDVGLAEALGKDIVEEIVIYKLETEVNQNPKVPGNDQASYAKERELYFKFC